jgi:hypothetical protein
MAGTYSLQILFSGILGANSPVDLIVQSAATDLSSTYGYGAVRHSTAGVTSSIYVQTRDSYGNNILVDPEIYPSGTEDIVFELCISVRNDPSRVCSGGVQELSLSVSLAYGVGPPGTEGIAYGLYRLTYFPFTDGIFTPMVRHNNTLIACLFDTSALPEAEDPGAAEVDKCIFEVNSGTGFPTTRHLSRATRYGDMTLSYIQMVVNTTFKEPDLQSARHFTFLAPILAAIIGIIVDLIFGVIIPDQRYRYRKTHGIVIEDSDSSKNPIASDRYLGYAFTRLIQLE